MFFPYLSKLLLLPSILLICSSHIAQASLQPAPCSQVFVLGESKTGGATISTALKILGYTQIPPSQITNQSSPSLTLDGFQNVNTFTTLSSPLAYTNVASLHPDAKFILPLEANEYLQPNTPGTQPCARTWLRIMDLFKAKKTQEATEENLEHFPSPATLVEEAFVDLGRRENLLKMAMSKTESYGEERWPELCKFLGFGYSFVERLRLREFPNV